MHHSTYTHRELRFGILSTRDAVALLYFVLTPQNSTYFMDSSKWSRLSSGTGSVSMMSSSGFSLRLLSSAMSFSIDSLIASLPARWQISVKSAPLNTQATMLETLVVTRNFCCRNAWFLLLFSAHIS